MKELFIEKKMSNDSMSIVDLCNDILGEYESAGYDLSLRQLYYQLVARNHVPNTEQSYKRVGSIVSDARLAGLMDWDTIKDRGREAVANSHWRSPADIVDGAARQYRIDLWADQPMYVEVMVEKQALEGVLLPVCTSLDVTFTANKGYSSSSSMYEAGQRMAAQIARGKRVVVLYLGDHDPSGIDMTRDVADRLGMFARDVDEDLVVQRVALNMSQVRALNPPENPAKLTDSRAAEYVRRFGASSWELDAIEPKALADLVEGAITAVRDESLWLSAVARQDKGRADLAAFAKAYRSAK